LYPPPPPPPPPSFPLNKNKLTTTILILAFVLTFILTACKEDTTPEPGPDPRAAYFGTWKYANDGSSPVTISANKIVCTIANDGSYTLEDLTWTPFSGGTGKFSGIPGYKITGTVTALTGEPDIFGIAKAGTPFASMNQSTRCTATGQKGDAYWFYFPNAPIRLGTKIISGDSTMEYVFLKP